MTFDDLARLPVIQYYETAFRKVTGMSLKVIPPSESAQRLSFGGFENPFCSLVTRTPVGCNACWEAEKRAERGAGKKLIPEQVSCFAGLTDVAVPVIVNGQHVATLMTGQIFRRPPTERDFQMILKAAQERGERRLGKADPKSIFRNAGRHAGPISGHGAFAQRVRPVSGRRCQRSCDFAPG